MCALVDANVCCFSFCATTEICNEFCRKTTWSVCVFILFSYFIARRSLEADGFALFFFRVFFLNCFCVFLQVERTKLMASQDALKTDADAMRMEVQHFMKEGRLQVNPKFTSLTSIKVQLMTLTRLAYRQYTQKKKTTY
jgi:hypothetical protein